MSKKRANFEHINQLTFILNTMAKKLSLKNTKNEMLDAYEALVKELASFESQAKTAQTALDKAKQEQTKLQQQLANLLTCGRHPHGRLREHARVLFFRFQGCL